MVCRIKMGALFDYCPISGKFKRKCGVSKKYKEEPGYIHKGYRVMTIDGKEYQAHRLAWLYVYGEFPKGPIDHIDQDKLNNSIGNLRVATSISNSRNRPLSKNNSSGLMGVRYLNGKWRARIYNKGKEISLGTYDNLLDAASSRKSYEITLGYHPNHGNKKALAR